MSSFCQTAVNGKVIFAFVLFFFVIFEFVFLCMLDANYRSKKGLLVCPVKMPRLSVITGVSKRYLHVRVCVQEDTKCFQVFENDHEQ